MVLSTEMIHQLIQQDSEVIYRLFQQAVSTHKMSALRTLVKMLPQSKLFKVINKKNERGLSVLQKAIILENIEAIDILLDSLSVVDQIKAINKKDRDGWTGLYQAVVDRKIKVIEALCRKVPDSFMPEVINQKNNQGWTVLYQAVISSPSKAEESEDEIISLLLSKLPAAYLLYAINQKDNNGKTLVERVISTGNTRTIKTFIDALLSSKATDCAPLVMSLFKKLPVEARGSYLHNEKYIHFLEQLINEEKYQVATDLMRVCYQEGQIGKNKLMFSAKVCEKLIKSQEGFSFFKSNAKRCIDEAEKVGISLRNNRATRHLGKHK